MKQIILFFFLFFAKLSFAQINDTIIEKTINKLENLSSVSYKLLYSENFTNLVSVNFNWFLISKDFNKNSVERLCDYEFKIKKNLYDTIIGYQFRYSEKNDIKNVIVNYDNGKYHKININDSLCTNYNLLNNPSQIIDIESIVHNLNSLVGVLNILKKYNTKFTSCTDTIHGQAYYKYSYSLNDDQKYMSFWINNKTYLPEKLTITLVNQLDTNIIERRFLNIKYNQSLSDEEFNLQEFINFKIQNYDLSSAFKNVIHTNINAPEILFNDTLKLTDFQGENVLLMYWSRNCGHSIYSIKSLKYLEIIYNVKIILISGDRNSTKIQKAINNHRIEFQVFKVDKKIKKDYNLFAFPTFILIDKSGTIKYSAIGNINFVGCNLENAINEIYEY
jgi:thiol-disulfide isomerase/thioredoxin